MTNPKSDVEIINDATICSAQSTISSLLPLNLTTKQKAYRAAAWILIMAEVNDLPDESVPSTFEEILDAIKKA